MNKHSSSDEHRPGHRIVYEPAGISSSCTEDCSIIDDAARLGIVLRTDCGGHGICGKCRIIVTTAGEQPEPTEIERRLLTNEELRNGHRLACRCYPSRDLRITIPEESIESREAGSKDLLTGRIMPDPLVRRQVSAPEKLVKELGDLCRLPASTLPHGWSTVIAASALRGMGEAFDESRFTTVNHRQFGLTAILPGAHERSLGLAFDVGTTTLAGYLGDFSDGSIIASASVANPQRRHGEDVVSRIAYAMEFENGTTSLQRLVIDGLNQLIEICTEKAGVDSASIDEVCLVGNPTMQHLCLGINPRSLGSYPYLPVTRQALDVRAADVGLRVRQDINLHVFPVISGFVGGDTIAAVLADKTHKRSEVTLLIDIGTNGELVLGNSEGLWSTSCATGPALEGAHISCGMRAMAGAIDTVVIDPATFRPDIHVLGNNGTKPLGLCGSGIIDAVAEMVKTGLLLPSGRIREGLPGVVADENGIGQQFILYQAEPEGTGRQVVLSLPDVRQVQLAKAALFTGIDLLMKRSGHRSFDRLVLTGAFGAHFNWINAAAIGMLPPMPDNVTVEVIKNGAGQGAVNALFHRASRISKDHLAEMMTVLDLAEDPDFTLTFTMATSFPRVSG